MVAHIWNSNLKKIYSIDKRASFLKQYVFYGIHMYTKQINDIDK